MATRSLFDQAAQVFEGWTDARSGLRVLRVIPKNLPFSPGMVRTVYHQMDCFTDGGRTVMLNPGEELTNTGWPTRVLLDLSTGEARRPSDNPDDHFVHLSRHGTAMVVSHRANPGAAFIRDLRTGWESPRITTPPGWVCDGRALLADGRGGAFSFHRSPGEGTGLLTRYDHLCHSQLWFLDAAGPRKLREGSGHLWNHVVASPADPKLFSYDAWPSPRRDVDQVIRVHRIDGGFDELAALDDKAPRPGDFWGVRDHYVWTPDNRRIVSYLNADKLDMNAKFNHFSFNWWLSALDWRTGEDFAAQYPPGRWGGHMGVSPDSRQILCAGGPGYDKLFLVDIAKLRDGWNERVLCDSPRTVSLGTNNDPFPMPFALPDQSGVIFNAGWPGPEFGVYLVEWPRD